MLGRALEKAVSASYESQMQLLLELLTMNSSTFYYTKEVQDRMVILFVSMHTENRLSVSSRLLPKELFQLLSKTWDGEIQWEECSLQ